MGRKKQLSDADLLAFAQAAFIREGLSAPTREIARAAGVSEAVLFQRYKTKADLFFAAMVPPPVELDALLEGAGGDFRVQLRQVFDALIDYFRLAYPILAQLSVHPDFRFDEFAAKHPQSSMIAMVQQLLRFLAGRLDPDQDLNGVTLSLIAATHSIAAFEAMGAHGGKFEPFMVDSIFATLWNGMKPAGPAAATRALPPWPPKLQG